MITGRRPSASAWATRRWMRITLGQVALTHRTPRASRSSSTDFNSPWDRITTVSPAARPAGSSVFRTPRRARSSTTWELWIRSPSIQHPPVSSPVFAANSTYTNPLSAIEFFKKTGVDALAISYGTMHGASKGKDVKLRKEIPIAIKECMNHEGIQGALVSHGSSTVPQYIVNEINALGGNIQNAYGISKEELKAAIPCGIGKINVDTDIRLAVTRNFRELFRDHPELKEDARVGGVWKLLDEKRDAFDPRAFLAPIMDTVMYGTGDEGAVALITDAMRRGVKEAVGTLIVEFGSYGKAPLVEPATLEDMAARYAKEG